ncbi:MAG: ketoacyl-ACP synthase III [Alphaproteobacteria bacterium]|jgi:3-oxoacyl-[acyl-carrier-protein] synthase III|nr:ketoacyl-ACP synthase III [Alphaproteobacteria bacterium]
MRRSQIIGFGSYLPKNVVTNDDLARKIDTSDEWIRKRTGITQRHIAAEGELTSDIAEHAARAALDNAGVSSDEIDLIVLATATPDNTFPATAARVQSKLGIRRGAAFDVQAVCAGYVYALATADNMIRLGQAETALVIGAEVFSRILDWEDRGTCVLFGDGAGATVLRGSDAAGTNQDRGILSTHIYSDGEYYDMLYVDGGPSTTGTSGYLRMEGKEVFRHAVQRMSEVVETALETNGLKIDDVDWLIPHQANKRIMDSIAKKLSFPAEKIVVTVDKQANTSAATIPLALAEAASDGRLKKGNLIALSALGGGFSWGSALFRL